MAQLLNYPSHIPVEPHVYALLSQGYCDEKLKMPMSEAVSKYNKKCEEAYLQLIDDLKECLGKESR